MLLPKLPKIIFSCKIWKNRKYSELVTIITIKSVFCILLCGVIVLRLLFGILTAQTFDGLGDVSDMYNLQAEFFAHFDGLAKSDSSVVDHQIDMLVGVLVKLYHTADTELENFLHSHVFFGNFDNDGDFHRQNPVQMSLRPIGRVLVGLFFGLS